MSGTTESDSPATQPPVQPNKLKAAFWPIAIFVAVMLYVQWPAVKDLYYRLSGIEPPKSTIPWRENFQSALDEVRTSDKPMLLVFGASWCGYCNTMDRNVWSDPKVGDSATAGFVPMHIDVDDTQHAEVVKRYRVGPIPAIYVLDADGEILARQAYMTRSETLAFLEATGRP